MHSKLLRCSCSRPAASARATASSQSAELGRESAVPASKLNHSPPPSCDGDARSGALNSSTARRMDAGLKSVPSGLERASWPAARSRSPTPSEKHEPSSSSDSSWRRSGRWVRGSMGTSVRKVGETTIAYAASRGCSAPRRSTTPPPASRRPRWCAPRRGERRRARKGGPHAALRHERLWVTPPRSDDGSQGRGSWVVGYQRTFMRRSQVGRSPKPKRVRGAGVSRRTCRSSVQAAAAAASSQADGAPTRSKTRHRAGGSRRP